MNIWITILQLIGTVSFAVSGAMTAMRKEMDVLGDPVRFTDVAGAEEDVEPAIVAIEDEETPLAPGAEEKANMSWWWLLIVALLGATGYKMYKDHQKKKEEAAQEA